MKHAILLLLLTATTTATTVNPAPKQIVKGWFSPGIPAPCMPADYRENCKRLGY